ncbi:MAG: fumarylacetoacetate hydrolase family protein [Alphaproteobacteria bacterium]|nr:fumarylacetoacetate hydrolase family protein [Alphaproteobacteria bacterium]
MRLVSYRADGQARYGAVVEGGVVDLVARVGDRWPTLRTAIAAGALPAVAAIVAAARPDRRLDDIELAPVVPDPDKILCVGLNYRSHASEVGRELPPHPSVFSRLHNTLLPHGGAIMRPRVSTNLDFEGELAVIIGRRCRHVPEAQALSVVAGYTCFNDASVRDFQKHSVTAGKNFPTTGPLGPWMVTADEIPDPQALRLTTRLSGTTVQDDTTDHMIYPVARIIAYLSSFTVLEAGDVIATGTPAGVGLGRDPPLWMKAGDTIEVEISGIGTLRNRIVDE